MGLGRAPGLKMRECGAAHPVERDGPLQFAHDYKATNATGRALFDAGARAAAGAGAGMDTADHVIPHQVSGRIGAQLAEHLGVAENRFFVNANRVGNTGSAAIWLALDEVRRARPRSGHCALVLGAEPPRVTRLSRKALIGVGAVTAAGLGGALVLALQTKDGKHEAQELYTTGHKVAADGLSALPANYAAIPKLGPPLPGDFARPMLNQAARGTPLPAGGTIPGTATSAPPNPIAQRRMQEDEIAHLPHPLAISAGDVGMREIERMDHRIGDEHVGGRRTAGQGEHLNMP